ncbi:hypothetical protein ETAA8_40590 [Anatilimnocola aggregata]|uniref:Uncharacterized protein n=1 Tax=Anatilimnocola aggregata TaxID=2528021 RepID=A0A517YFE8_9BACT|nr:hypothetical protein [Anatilimnocola aggregata]QDU28953.1 hypothetical protein ETAA8_40590 [Anatilimnocola aggregata]
MNIYRYRFNESVPAEEIEAAILLAIWGCEALHGESQTRLDAAHFFDLESKTCIIDAGTDVGRDFCRLFVNFVRRECGDDSFEVERATTADALAPSKPS